MNIKTHGLLLSLGALLFFVQADAAPSSGLPDGSFLYRMAQEQVDASETKARLTQVRQQAAHIRVGTSRAQIERLFSRDGGLMASDVTHYYVGYGVMVNVPYDLRGGAWNAQNRVRGPLKIYLSSPHYD